MVVSCSVVNESSCDCESHTHVILC